MPMDLNIVLSKSDVLQVNGEESRSRSSWKLVSASQSTAKWIWWPSGKLLHSGHFVWFNHTMTFGRVHFGLGNAVGLLLSGIMLGFLQATNHPTFGYVPQGALNMVKRLGFDVLHGRYRLKCRLDQDVWTLNASRPQVIDIALVVRVFCRYSSTLSRCLHIEDEPSSTILGAIIGARTCAPAMDIVNDHARSTIPALGYAGTYAIANILMMLNGYFHHHN